MTYYEWSIEPIFGDWYVTPKDKEGHDVLEEMVGFKELEAALNYLKRQLEKIEL